MPTRKLILKPGVNLEQTPTLNQAQFVAATLCRFYNGLIQKIGGWAQIALQALVGTCRGLHGWADIVGNAYLAAGTEQRLTMFTGDLLYDITPVYATNNPAVAFSTVSGTNVVTVTDATTSPTVGDWINQEVQVAVGGLIVFGYYQVATIVDATHYTILASSNATSTVTNGGAVPSFATQNGLATITTTLTNHGFATGSLFPVLVSTTVATVVIFGTYSVTRLTANTFSFTAGSAANATTSGSENSGNARIAYLLPTSFAVNTVTTGYGIGDYGAGDYGLSSGGQTVLMLRQWSLDHFGQDLIASPTNGKIYYWMPPTVAPASVVSGSAPIYNTTVFVMPQVEIVVALGAEVGGVQQPLLVRWCDQADFTDWTTTATNQAGSYFIPSGTRLVAGLAAGLGALVWTDTDLWTMTYLGFPLVFGFNRLATACGIISQRAAGAYGTSVMWLSNRGFFDYAVGGGVTPMECPVWDFLINNIDLAQAGQIHCAVNSLFNEMAWHFPLLSTSPYYVANVTVMGYVKINYIERCWDFGVSAQYQRTAWVGISPVGYPVGADLSGLLQQHEVSTDANGAGLEWSWQTGYFDMQEGEEFVYSDLIIPDFVSTGNPVFTPTVLMTDYPYASPTNAVVPSITALTNFIPFSARGRQMAIGMSGSDLGTFNRLGALRYRFASDGKN